MNGLNWILIGLVFLFSFCSLAVAEEVDVPVTENQWDSFMEAVDAANEKREAELMEWLKSFKVKARAIHSDKILTTAEKKAKIKELQEKRSDYKKELKAIRDGENWPDVKLSFGKYVGNDIGKLVNGTYEITRTHLTITYKDYGGMTTHVISEIIDDHSAIIAYKKTPVDRHERTVAEAYIEEDFSESIEGDVFNHDGFWAVSGYYDTGYQRIRKLVPVDVDELRDHFEKNEPDK